MIRHNDINWEIPTSADSTRIVRHDALLNGAMISVRRRSNTSHFVHSTGHMPITSRTGPRSMAVTSDSHAMLFRVCEVCGTVCVLDDMRTMTILGERKMCCVPCTSFAEYCGSSESFLISANNSTFAIIAADGSSLQYEKSMGPRANRLVSEMSRSRFQVKYSGKRERTERTEYSYALIMKRTRGCTLRITRSSLIYEINHQYSSAYLTSCAGKESVMAFVVYDRALIAGYRNGLDGHEYTASDKQFRLNIPEEEYCATAYIIPGYESYFRNDSWT